MPSPFLEARVRELAWTPAFVALCAGYEDGRWRSEQLAEHLMNWLAEFALRYSERESLRHFNAVALIGKAARSVYTSPSYKKRGEFGELLLHAILRQECGTIPAISKIFYKGSSNDPVKGFDAVHVVDTPDSLELWLGEVKFYSDVSSAINDVMKELRLHTETDYLRLEFAAIVNMIDADWPHADRLKKLLRPETSLDQIFDRACIPVLLTYDSEVIRNHAQVSGAFLSAFRKEVTAHHQTFCGKLPSLRMQLRLFLVPLGSKASLVEAAHRRLEALQKAT